MSVDQSAPGFVSVGRILGVPLRLHISALVVGVAGIIGGFGVTVAALLFLLVGHEMGHALLIRRCGYEVVGVDLSALGGRCLYLRGANDDWHDALIAWGGVGFQALLLLPLLAWVLCFPVPRGIGAIDQLLFVFVPINALMILYNLVPLRHLDGAVAWQVFPLWAGRRQRGLAKAAQAEKREEDRRVSVSRARGLARGLRVIDGGRDEEDA